MTDTVGIGGVAFLVFNRWLEPTAGAVSLDGQDVGSLSRDALRSLRQSERRLQRRRNARRGSDASEIAAHDREPAVAAALERRQLHYLPPFQLST